MFSSILEFAGFLYEDIRMSIQAKLGLIKFPDYLPEKIICQVSNVVNFSSMGCFYFTAHVVSPSAFSRQEITINPSTESPFQHRGVVTTTYSKDYSADDKNNNEYPRYMHKGNPYGLAQKSDIFLAVSHDELNEMIEKTANLDSLMSKLMGENEKRPVQLFVEITTGEVFSHFKTFRQQYVKDYRLISEYKSNESVSAQIIN